VDITKVTRQIDLQIAEF